MSSMRSRVDNPIAGPKKVLVKKRQLDVSIDRKQTANPLSAVKEPLISTDNSVWKTIRRPHVLLIFDFSWDDAKGILMGISRYSGGNWEVMIDMKAAAINEKWWIRENWDGIITRHTSPMLLEVCRKRKIPLIDLNDSPRIPGFPKIRPDNFAIGHMGAEHFLERGFKNFAFCGLTESWAQERREGFVEALRLTGKHCNLLEEKYSSEDPNWEAEQKSNIKAWLRELSRPLAIMGCNDLRAWQVVSACQDSGIHVPGDVAVLGANNDYLRCAFGSPPLSSVASDRQLAGYRAAELLDQMMRAGVHQGNDDVRIDPLRVVVRHSTDILAIDDRKLSSAIHYIRQFACQGISADSVAEHVGVSRHALERKFRQKIGRSPHSEIRNVQIARIKQLLIETDMPLKNIAEVVGVRHTEYIIVMFAREVGVTPGAFRREHQPKTFTGRLSSTTEPDLKEEI